MRTMTWEEIDRDWAGLQKRHRGEIAAAVARYCVGHKIFEVAHRLKYSRRWVEDQLIVAGVNIGCGGGDPTFTQSTKLKGGRDVSKDVTRLATTYGPTEEEQASEEFLPYMEHYANAGYEEEVAAKLARAEWAGEAAVEAGVIKEEKTKKDEKINRILFPSDSQDTDELRFREHMARVESAAKWLDAANMAFLRRKTTCKKVASVHAKWLEQVERIRNLHPTFDEVL